MLVDLDSDALFFSRPMYSPAAIRMRCVVWTTKRKEKKSPREDYSVYTRRDDDTVLIWQSFAHNTRRPTAVILPKSFSLGDPEPGCLE